MGVCAPKPVQVFPGGATAPLVTTAAGGRFPDVSSWQGDVSWLSVKRWQQQHGWTPGGVFKLGEYAVDPFAAHNNAELKSLGMFRAGYWFVRNTGCSSEARQIIAEANLLGLKVVIEDLEVSEAAGYGQCLTPKLKSAGFIVVSYTSPGSDPGGIGSGTYAWMAAYGAVLPTPPFSNLGLKAWQCTDGAFGCVTEVPGIGKDDVSIDYGMLKLGAAPVDPYAIYPKTKFALANGVTASEYNTVKTWYANHCANPARRPVCTSSHYHAELLRDREWFVANHNASLTQPVHPPRWAFNSLGERFQGLSHIIG